MSPHDYFQPNYESCVHYNKQTGGKTDLSLDLGKLLKFRPSKIENFEENLEGKSPSLFADCQVRAQSSVASLILNVITVVECWLA